MTILVKKQPLEIITFYHFIVGNFLYFFKSAKSWFICHNSTVYQTYYFFPS